MNLSPKGNWIVPTPITGLSDSFASTSIQYPFFICSSELIDIYRVGSTI
ncbi:uncharacterized protein ACHE_60050A [Aspergillus chevalieri]|uniref:Uncharacterized protein n=1 Tax=Aspergillus chevalieri TaxID=182096 RepID=A0A7R7VSW0_ASPCH|nr:uncharacterized protein ACHE_60050A [Aspergillus chevalieri]BCR90164.1 hypothetical protein ACHE_60050A [Aspergillus chevalieri]